MLSAHNKTRLMFITGSSEQHNQTQKQNKKT